MAARAVEGHAPAVAIRGDNARPHGELADRHAWPIMQAVYGVTGEALEQPVPHHGARTAPALLRWLEDQHRRSREIAVRSEVARGPEQHRRVTVMAAGMHDARIL